MQVQLNGITLAYDDRGQGPPVVLLHAFPLDRTMWAQQVAALEDSYRVITPDLRGHGETGLAADATTLSMMADDVIGLLDLLEIGSVVLGGLSMGGYVALNLVRRYPDRVAGLILADTRAGADSAEGRAGRAATAQKALDQGAGAIAEQLIPKLFAEQTHSSQPELVAQVRKVIEAADPKGIAAASHAMAARDDSSGALQHIVVPTLILVGAEDALTPPKESEAMRTALPDAQLEVIAGAGHLSNLEQPAVFNRAVRIFVDRLGQG